MADHSNDTFKGYSSIGNQFTTSTSPLPLPAHAPTGRYISHRSLVTGHQCALDAVTDHSSLLSLEPHYPLRISVVSARFLINLDYIRKVFLRLYSLFDLV